MMATCSKLIIGSGYVAASIASIFLPFPLEPTSMLTSELRSLPAASLSYLIRRADTQQWLTVGSWNTPGIIENVDLSQVYSGNIDGVG
jgi:hypothetical protein